MFWIHVSTFNSLIPLFLAQFIFMYTFSSIIFICLVRWMLVRVGFLWFSLCSFHFLRMDFLFGWNNSIFMAIVPNRNLVGELFCCFCAFFASKTFLSVNVYAMCVLLIWSHIHHSNIQHSKWFMFDVQVIQCWLRITNGSDGGCAAGYCIYAIKRNKWILASALVLTSYTEMISK